MKNKIIVLILGLVTCCFQQMSAAEDVGMQRTLPEYWAQEQFKQLKFKVDNQSIHYLAVSEDDRYVVATGSHATVFDLSSKEFPWTVQDQIRYASFASKAKLLMLATANNDIVIWDVEKNERVGGWHESCRTLPEISSDGKFLTLQKNGSATVFEYPALKQIGYHYSDVMGCCFVGQRLFVSHQKGVIGEYEVRDVTTNTLNDRINFPLSKYHSLIFLTYEGGILFLQAIPPRQVIIQDTKTGRVIFSRSLPANKRTREMSCSKDGSLLAIGYDDGSIELWNIQTGCMIKELKGHHWPICCMQFSPDGTILVSGTEDGEIGIWKRGE